MLRVAETILIQTTDDEPMTSSSPEHESTVVQIIERHRNELGALMPVLHDVQRELGYIPAAVIPMISKGMNLSRAEIQGVIGFYHDFRSEPPGQTVVQICRAEACQAMGARELEAHAKSKLGIELGETTRDGRFTLDPVYCLGNCACSPSIRIGDDIHARVSTERFDALLEKAGADA